MSECDWSERVALLVGDDLAANEVPDVQRHIDGCAPCADLLTELRADRELLQTPPAVADASVLAVRSVVMGRVRRRRSPVWLSLVAGLALVACSAGLWTVTQRESVPLPQLAKTAPVSVVPRTAEPQPRPERTRRTEKRHRAPAPLRLDELAAALRDITPPKQSEAARSTAQVVITAMTSDPDVVIVLIGETKEGGL